MSEWVNLQTLIQSIFHPISPASLAEANTQLLTFAESKAAWYACFELISLSEDINVRFFVINLIYNKIRRQWTQLDSCERPQLIHHLRQILTAANASTERSFLSRVILCLACCSALTPEGIQQYIAFAIDFTRAPDVAYIRIGLEMLAAVCEESEELDLSRAGKVDVKAQLVEMSNGVFECLNSMTVSQYSGDVQLQFYTMKVLRIWSFVLGLTLSSLITEHSLLWGGIYQSLTSLNPLLIGASCTLLRGLVSVQEFPLTQLRITALESLVSMLLSESVISSLFSFFKDESQTEVMLQVAHLYTSLAETEIEYFSGVGFRVDLFQSCLHCLASRPRKVAAITFDLWIRIPDVAVTNRNPYLREQIFYEIVERLVLDSIFILTLQSYICLQHNQIIYPAGFIHWDECEEDEDDFAAFRDHRQGIQEVIASCFNALGGRYFTFLNSKLENHAINQPPSWQILESILQFSIPVVPHFKANEAQLTQEPRLFLKRIFAIILMSNRIESPILAETACRFLQASTFLLTSQKPTFMEFQEYFWPALQLCLHAMAKPSTCATAAKTMHQLTVHGSKILLRDGNSILSIIQMSTSLLPSLPQDAALTTVEANTRIAVQLNSNEATTALTAAFQPLTSALSTELQSINPSSETIARLLEYCAQVIRFCDTVNSDVLQPLLTMIWPLVKLVEAKEGVIADEEVIESIFKLYRSSLNSALALVLPEIDGIGQSITRVIGNGFVGQKYALNCASTLLEVLKSKTSEEVIVFLSHFIETITQLFLTRLQEGSYDAEALESYFSFLYSAQLHSAHALSASPMALDTIPRLCITCLRVCKERTVLRNVLQVLQATLAPPYSGTQPFHAVMAESAMRYAPQMIDVLIHCLAGDVTSANRQNVIDAITLLLTSKDDQGFISSSIVWVQTSFEKLNIPQLDPETRNFVIQAMFRLVRSNPRRFKALMQDFSKVCCSEMQPDCFMAYE